MQIFYEINLPTSLTACAQMTCAVLLFDRPMSHQIISAFLCIKHFRTLAIVNHININHVSKLGVFIPTTSAHCFAFLSKPDTAALLSFFLLPTLLQLIYSGPSTKRPICYILHWAHHFAKHCWAHNGTQPQEKGSLEKTITIPCLKSISLHSLTPKMYILTLIL